MCQLIWIASDGMELGEAEFNDYLNRLADDGRMFSVFFYAVLLRQLLKTPREALRFPKNVRKFHVLMLKVLFSDAQDLEDGNVVPVLHMLVGLEAILRSVGFDRIGNFVKRKYIFYREKHLERAGILKERVLGHTWSGPIGHLVTAAYYAAAQKSQILPYESLAVTSGTQPSNPYFRSLYLEQCPVSVREIEYEEELERHSKHSLEKVEGAWASGFYINREIEKHADPTCKGILELSQQGDGVLKAWKEKHGISEDARIVTVHVRTAGYRTSTELVDRNWDIERLLPAVRELVKRGYTVVRLGDPSMPALPEMEGVIDYALSSEKSDVLDIALVARAVFHIGSSSGMSLVPMVFATPTLFLNWNARSYATPWSVRSWTVFKPLYDIETGERVLDPGTLKDLSFVFDDEVMVWKGYRREDLTETQITRAVLLFERHPLSRRETEVDVRTQQPVLFESAVDGTLVQTDLSGVPLTEKGKALLQQG